MATKKLLNIVVDGNSALGPYWPKIVSDYLEKIVRSLFGNPRGEVVNPSYEVGLILYNFNSTLGLDYVQCFNWTRDVDQFLGFLPYLPFNRDNLNQHTIVKGLAEALVMFPKDDYFKCERHCILVATGEPVARSMPVSLPVVKEGKFIAGQFITLDATFLRVAKMFGPLGVSLSVVTPNCHPLFISIFNLGNNLKEDTPITNYGNGQISVLLSRNFKEAHYAILIPQETTLEEDHLTPLLEQENQIYLDEILGEMLRSSSSTAGEGSLPQNNPDSWRLEELNAWYSPGAGASSLGPSASLDVGASSGGNAGASASTDAGVVVGAIASDSPYYGSHPQQFPRHHHFEMTEINPTAMVANNWASPALVMHEYNHQAIFWPKPPTDFKDYVQAWEGCLVGRIHSGTSLNQAKAFRRLTSSVRLTDHWSNRLNIAIFFSKMAVPYTMKFNGGPIDHLFFQVTQFDNLNLYEHLMSNDLCAKIILPFHTIILSTTDIMHQYLGLVFPGDMVFFQRPN